MLHAYENYLTSANWISVVTREINGVWHYSQEITLNALERKRHAINTVVKENRLTLDMSHNLMVADISAP